MRHFHLYFFPGFCQLSIKKIKNSSINYDRYELHIEYEPATIYNK